MSAPPPPGPPSGNPPPGEGAQPPGGGWSTPPPPPPGGTAPPPPPGGTAPPPPPGGTAPPHGAGWGGPPPPSPENSSWGSGAAPAGGARRPGELLDRFLARLIDHILVGIVSAIVVSTIVIGTMLGTDGNLYTGYGDNVLAGVLSALLSTALLLGYFVFMETQQGRTLGKMVMKLHVEGPGGAKPTVAESFKRNIWMALPLLGIVPVIGGVVGSVAQLVAVILIAVGISNDTARRQPWTDKLAGTQVIKNG